MDPLLTTEDVANFLRVDVVTVRRLVVKGELPAYRVGGEYRFIGNEIENYVKRQRVYGEDVIFKDKLDRFTERARKVLSFAQEEAQRLQHNFVGTEHLLLALVREGEGVAAKSLENLGVVDLVQIRNLVETFVKPGEKGVDGEIDMTRRAKKVIELAVDEARRLHHHYIGTEHLLLGLLREGDGIAAKVLEKLNVDLKKARVEVVQVLTSLDLGKPESESPTE